MTYPSRDNVLGSDSLGSLVGTTDPTGRDADEGEAARLGYDPRDEDEDAPRPHYVQTDIDWAGSGRDDDPWIKVSWNATRCTCDRPHSHAYLIN